MLLSIYGRKRFFQGFETCLTTFTALYWALWWLFCFDRTYRWQHTGGNVSLQGFKLVLQHLLHFFDHFSGYFVSIGRIFAKTCAKTYHCWLRNQFYYYDIFFEHFGGYFSLIGCTVAKILPIMFFTAFERGFTAFAVLFWAIFVLFCIYQMNVQLLRYGRKCFLRARKRF